LALSSGIASGLFAQAFGSDSTATGSNSVAAGGGQASAGYAIAFGVGTNAQTWGTVVVGHYNQPASGNATAWTSSAPVFVVGRGVDSGTAANAMSIYYNGSTTLAGNATLTDTNHQAQVNGAASFNGPATFVGNVTMGQASGDIPMGPFGGN